MKFNLSFIGSGNVATNLAHACYQAGHSINQVISRNEANAKELASKFGAYYGVELSKLYNDSDIIIICVSDDSYAEVLENLPLGLKAIVCHTSGPTSINVLSEKATQHGVIYPLQSLAKNKVVSLLETPIFVEGSTSYVKEKLYELADSISNKVDEVNSEERMKYHLAAVFANNFSNLMYVISKRILDDENLKFKHLLPIIKETVYRLDTSDPERMQTGPAKRGDNKVIEKHLEMISNQEVRKIYEIMTEFIMTEL